MHLGGKKGLWLTAVSLLEKCCCNKQCYSGEKLVFRGGESVSACLHTGNAPQPTARLCPDLNPVTVLVILHDDEIKTQSGPTAMGATPPSMWGMADVSCTTGFWGFLLVSALSHIKETIVWVFLIAFDYIKQTNNNPTQNCTKIKTHYL